MAGIQLVAIVFAIGMVYLTYSSYRRRSLGGTELALWMAIWIGLMVVSAFPDRLRGVIGPLRIARLLDLVMIGGIMLLSALVFTLNRTVRRLEDRLSRLVRELALEEAERADDQASASE